MRRIVLLVVGLAVASALTLGGCSAPRKSTIPVDSPLRPWTPPDPETLAPEETDAPAAEPAPAPAPPAPAPPTK